MKALKGIYLCVRSANQGWLLALCLLFLTGCEEILKENPKTLAVETFYNTKAEVEAATNAIYMPLRSSSTNGMGVYMAVLETHIDYAYGRGSYAVLNDFSGLDNVNIGRVSGAWEAFYLSIRNANLVIKNAPGGNSISQADVKRFVAEAKFLRAFSYFHLVRNWGGVPIRTEDNMTIIDLKRNSVSEVYELILDDLTEAESELPDQASLPGRPTKWAAKTMLSDVFLQLERFSEARDKALEVTRSGKFSLVSVSSSEDFQRIFGPDVMTSSEEIFYLKFSRQMGQGNLFPTLTNHPGTGFLGQNGVFGLHSDTNNPVYKNWNENDLRKGIWYGWNLGIGSTSLLSKKYIDPNSQEFAGAGNDVTWYRYADVLLIYAEAAARAQGAPNSECIEALNQVHRRAFGKNPLSPSEVDFQLADYATTELFLDLLTKERGYEFQYEGKRWIELKRTGKAKEIILAAKGKQVSEKHFLWPIPVSELNYNKAIDAVADQNLGY